MKTHNSCLPMDPKSIWRNLFPFFLKIMNVQSDDVQNVSDNSFTKLFTQKIVNKESQKQYSGAFRK